MILIITLKIDVFLGLLLSDTGVPGPTGAILLNGNRLMIGFESKDKNDPRSTISEGPRDEPKGRLFEVQRENFLWKTALETSFHHLKKG